MLISPQEGKGAPISQMRLNSRCAYNRIDRSRVIEFRIPTEKLRKELEMEAGDFTYTFDSIIRFTKTASSFS